MEPSPIQVPAQSRAIEAARIAKSRDRQARNGQGGSFEQQLGGSRKDAEDGAEQEPESPIARRLQVMARSRRKLSQDGEHAHIDVFA